MKLNIFRIRYIGKFIFMPWRKKGQSSDQDLNSQQCKSPNCPTPEKYFSRDECYQFDNLILCEFCYARHLSEKQTEIQNYTSVTKKVTEVSMSRVSPSKVSIQKNDFTNPQVSRITPMKQTDKFIEQLNNWKIILQSLEVEGQHTKIENVSKLTSSSITWMLESSVGTLLVSLTTKTENILKLQEEQLLRDVFKKKIPKPIIIDLNGKKIPCLDWLQRQDRENPSISINEKILRIIPVNNRKLFLIDDLNTLLTNSDNIELSFELGKIFYTLNFIGCDNLSKIFLFKDIGDFIFFNVNFSYSKTSFFDIKSSFRQFSILLPFILDQQNLEKFIEGTSEEKIFIEELLNKMDLKEKIKNFFVSNNIQFNESIPLISLQPFLQE
jgi:hypothetical protein